MLHLCNREATVGAPHLDGSRHQEGPHLLDAGRLWANLVRDLCARVFHRSLTPSWMRKQGKHYILQSFDGVVLMTPDAYGEQGTVWRDPRMP